MKKSRKEYHYELIFLEMDGSYSHTPGVVRADLGRDGRRREPQRRTTISINNYGDYR